MAVLQRVSTGEVGEHPIGGHSEAGVERSILLAKSVHDPDRRPLQLELLRIELHREQSVLAGKKENARVIRRAAAVRDQDLGFPGLGIENADYLAVPSAFIPDRAKKYAAISRQWSALGEKPSRVPRDGKLCRFGRRSSVCGHTYVTLAVLGRENEVTRSEPAASAAPARVYLADRNGRSTTVHRHPEPAKVEPLFAGRRPVLDRPPV